MDHKPLPSILGPKKGVPSLAAAHLQRWGLTLTASDYQIELKTTSAHANADGLSRLPPVMKKQCQIPKLSRRRDMINMSLLESSS